MHTVSKSTNTVPTSELKSSLIYPTGQTNKYPRKRRDRAAIHAAIQKVVIAEGQKLTCTPQAKSAHLAHLEVKDNGLFLRDLEEGRWAISPSLARAKLKNVGLPYEGRRAGIIYSWVSIFKAEGITSDVAERATRAECPHLFDDLIDGKGAAALLGYRDSSSIRKLVASGDIPANAYITFGNRGVYRFRTAGLCSLRRAPLARIV